jgi:hypothetical protein
MLTIALGISGNSSAGTDDGQKSVHHYGSRPTPVNGHLADTCFDGDGVNRKPAEVGTAHHINKLRLNDWHVLLIEWRESLMICRVGLLLL